MYVEVAISRLNLPQTLDSRSWMKRHRLDKSRTESLYFSLHIKRVERDYESEYNTELNCYIDRKIDLQMEMGVDSERHMQRDS